MTIEDLIKQSIFIPESGCEVCSPGEEKPTTIFLANIRSKFSGHYAVNNSTICYVYLRDVYVTPWTRAAEMTLHKEGFKEKYFYVPFSNWDYPKNEKTRWQHLRREAEASYRLDYEADCNEWCDEHQIGSLDGKTLKRCFRIPTEGILVKHPFYETWVEPACNEISMDSVAAGKIGRYCKNNGKVVFVYRDGHTYVAWGYWIVSELRSSGYKEGPLFVPFSNGEEIMDPTLAKMWAACK